MKCSVVIPTYNRPREIKACIESIVTQELLPAEVLIIDDASLSVYVVQEVKEKLRQYAVEFVYYKKDHAREERGSSVSRNIGMEKARHDVVFIFDDDVTVDKKFFRRIMEVWEKESDKNLLAVGGVIRNNRRKTSFEKFYNRMFGLSSQYVWDVNAVGFQVWDNGITKKTHGYYTHGGVCSYKKEITKKLQFTHFCKGRAALEDVDFALRAKKKGYYFVVEPRAKAVHAQAKAGREHIFVSGVREGANRRVIFQRHCEKSAKHILWFLWANIGWTGRQFLAGHIVKGIGMAVGSAWSSRI